MRKLLIILTLLMSIIPTLSSQSYDEMWKKVQTAQQKDLPKQIIEYSQEIYDRADKDKNFPQQMKAWVTLVQTKSDLDPDSFRIANFPPIPHEGAIQTAIYNAIMGSAYEVMRDTNIAENDEETQQDYAERSRECLRLALKDKKALAQESAEAYLPLIRIKDDSRFYQHDLLSLLTHFVCSSSLLPESEKAQIAGEVADYYHKQGTQDAWVLMRLEQIEHQAKHEDYNQRLDSETKKNALKELVEASKSLETGIDVAAEYIDLLYDKDEKADFARWALAQYQDKERLKRFDHQLAEILRHSLNINVRGNALANRPTSFRIQAENATSARFEVRRYHGRDKDNRLRTDGELLIGRDYTLCDDSLQTSRREMGYHTSCELSDTLVLPAGHYIYIAREGDIQDVEEVRITSLRLVFVDLPNDKMLLQVVENETGRPVADAKVKLYKSRDKADKTLTTDASGQLILQRDEKWDYAQASRPDADDETDQVSLYVWHSNSSQDTSIQTRLYTDRAIYRPGQTIHVAGLCYRVEGDASTVVADNTCQLILRDVNYREVQKVEVTSNEMGSFSTDMVLPKDLLPGQFTLRCESASISIRVEEYKRPTFTVEAQAAESEVAQSFSFGDTIQVEALAKAFSGVPVQGAQVHYRIESAEVSFWSWYADSWNMLAEADTLTDDAGRAVIPLFLNPRDLPAYNDQMLRYRVTFEVTDQAGETQQASYSLAVSHRTFSLQIVQHQSDSPAKPVSAFTIEAHNASQQEVAVTGEYYILDSQGLSVGLGSSDAPLAFQSGTRIELPADLTPGSYTIYARANDRDGTSITTQSKVTYYDVSKAIDLQLSQDRLTQAADAIAPARFDSDFYQILNATFGDQPGEMIFAPQQEDVWVNCLICTANEVIEQQQFVIGRRLYRLTLPYRPKYGDGVSLHFWYVRRGEFHQRECQFIYQRPDKRLQLSWSTFRDKLYPGQQEEWVLNIHRPDGQPVVNAELLGGMYDASLDELASHSWSFYLNFRRYVPTWNTRCTSQNAGHTLSCNSVVPRLRSVGRNYDELTEYLHDRWRRDRFVVGYAPTSRSHYRLQAVEDEMMCLAESAPAPKMAMAKSAPNMIEEEEAEANNAPSSSTEDAPALRTNFAETAFFYPHLRSDAKGDVHIAFTLPESLTEWKFMGLAHTQDVMYGQITAHAVARKDFMVQPNMPRFVREGDHAVITARIINQCDHDLSGTARIRLLDAATEQEVYLAEVPFDVAKEQTTAVSFPTDITDQYPMLICEVTAQTATQEGQGNFCSDGERNYLPVLTSKKYITESIPFFIEAEDTVKHVDVSSLFNQGSPTATHRRLLLEFTEHPEWTVIEALEGIKLPEYDNAPCFAASLYANAMASRLAQSIPGFEEALRYAKEHGIEATSPLQDNQELKELILTQSPWVRDAMAEAEQRERLLDLFDSKLMTDRIEKATKKLRKLQLSSGAWTWFEGMEGSYYITLSTCQHLSMLQSGDETVQKMLKHGLEFLDEKELEDYKYRLKHKYSLYPSSSTIDYLYACSFDPSRKVSKEVAKMRETYLTELEKNVRDLTILGRTRAAVILRAFGHTQAADDFLESAVQYTVTKPGMGRFYATDAAYYSWCDYRIPTQLAAMRALRQSSRADRQSLLREMQLWLIRQKQAQAWDSPMNTIGAVDFLLNTGENQCLSTRSKDTNGPAFTLNGKEIPATIDTTKFLAPQLGYIRIQLDDSLTKEKPQELVITPSATPLSISAPSLGRAGEGLFGEGSFSSGSLYAQYLEEMDHLQQQSSGQLKVSVKLIHEGGAQLKVGDKVTLRVILTADRDMDFVQLRVQRPACFEPTEQLSGYRWMNGRGGYVAQHDASTDIFFDTFRRGTMTYDLTFHVDRQGEYLSGVTTAQCAYAPEFSAHTGAIHIVVK